MPFIGQDWRSGGDTWIRTEGGWERSRLKPVRSEDRNSQIFHMDAESNRLSVGDADMTGVGVTVQLGPPNEADTSSDNDLSDSSSVEGFPQPHCFVKHNKASEFVGCTSMSEAFHKLNIGRVCTDVPRFNYTCKVIHILIRDKLQNLSGSARRILLSLVEIMVLYSLEEYVQVSRIRELVQEFMRGLNEGHHCGSPSLLSTHQSAISNFYDLLTIKQPLAPAECSEDSVTLLDLPQECFRAILRRLPDHQSLIEAASAHDALRHLVEGEQNIWASLCRFHFTAEQIKCVNERLAASAAATGADMGDWRHRYFELKKRFGLKEVYSDMIHICCHCKALFWKGLGHPCVSESAPSVRVTPQQFVDMLMFL